MTTDLLATLDHCARKVPLYAGVAPPDRSLAPDVAAREALARFPILTKDTLRHAFPQKLVPEGERLPDALRRKDVSFVGTSGTTGERVQVLWHQPWWDAQERDGFRAHSLANRLIDDPGYKEAVLTTPVCSGNLCHVAALPMAERIEGTILFLNQTIDPALWKDADVLRIADELDAFEPTALEADPAYLAHLVVRLLKLDRKPAAPRFIDLSYELPSRRHVDTIAKLFPVPILDAYGSTECGFVFMECDHGRLHHNTAWSHVEVVPLPDRKGLDGVGLLLVTPLRNRWLNLVRFDTGDLVRPSTTACPCGRAGLALDSVEGRIQDTLVREDGTCVPVRGVDRALADVPGLLHYRLRHKGPGDYELELVPTELEPLDVARARDALGPVLGVEPRTRVASGVPVEASGKFRLVADATVDASKLLRGRP